MGLTKTALAPKRANIFDKVMIFDFMRDEVEKFGKTLWGALAQQQ